MTNQGVTNRLIAKQTAAVTETALPRPPPLYTQTLDDKNAKL